MNEPTERSMERARVLVRDGFGESGQWQGIATDIAAALDEAREEGRREGLEAAARECERIGSRVDGTFTQKCDEFWRERSRTTVVTADKCAAAIRARANP